MAINPKLIKEDKCRVCGSKEDLQIDHIIPKILNGSDETENLQVLCKKHHQEKTNIEVMYRKNVGLLRKPFNISIQGNLIKEIKTIAIESNTNVSSIVEKLLKEFIKNYKKR